MNGKDGFGKIMVKNIKTLQFSANILIPDSGFVEEVEPLVKEFGPSKIFHIKLERKGHDFSADSRSYLDLTELGVKSFTVTNKRIDNFLLDGLTLVTKLAIENGG